MSQPRGWLFGAVVVAATTLSVPVPAADVVTIQLTDNLRFDPANVTVLVNTTVRWHNAGTSAWHTVTAYEDRLPGGAPYFDSSGAPNETAARQAPPEGFLRPGDVFEVTFWIPGDHAYFCVPHEGAVMQGVVRVVDRFPDEPGSDLGRILPVGVALGAAVVAIAAYVVLRRRVR